MPGEQISQRSSILVSHTDVAADTVSVPSPRIASTVATVVGSLPLVA